MVRRPRRPRDEPEDTPEPEDEPVSEPEIEPTYDPEPAPEPVQEPMEDEPMSPPPPPPETPPQPSLRAASGNGSRSAPPNIGGQAGSVTPATATTDQQAIIAQQQILIATQAQAVRDLEAALNLAPPPPTTPPAPPVTGVNLNTVITTQTAAIRTQAAYMQHLSDLQVALNPGS